MCSGHHGLVVSTFGFHSAEVGSHFAFLISYCIGTNTQDLTYWILSFLHVARQQFTSAYLITWGSIGPFAKLCASFKLIREVMP